MTRATKVVSSVVVGFCIFNSSVINSWAVAEDPFKQFKLASLAYQNERYDSSEQEFEAFLKHFPNHKLAGQAHLALGEIKFLLKKYPDAAEVFNQVSSKYGNSYVGMNAELRLGQCEFKMKKYLSAIDHFTLVKNKAPKVLRAEASLGWAHSLMALNDHNKAEVMFVDFLQSYPNYKKSAQAVIPLGLIYLERNRLQEALDLFALLPDDKGSQYYRGVALKKQGQIIAASQVFKDVYELDPDGFWADKAQLQMAEAYYQVGELNLAYDSYRKVYDKFLTSELRPYALHRMACINFQLGRFQEAGLKWEQLIRTFQDDVNLPNGIYMLGEMALRQGELGKAISFFSQITSAHELRMDSQYKILWCLAEQKQDETAIARANQFLREYPWGELAAKAHLIKGICLQRLKNYREANAEYQIVLDQFGNSIHAEKALYLMSTSYFQNKQLAEIVTSLNSTLKLAPVSPTRWQADTYLWIAEAYYALNQFEPASRTYKLIIDNYKDSPHMANAMLGLAAAMAEQGNFEEAGIAHERAMAMAEETQSKDVKRSILMDTAQVLFTQKKYEKAMGYFNEFVDRYPDDPLVSKALFQAGLCFYRLEYYTEAIKRWDRVVKSYPNDELAPESIYQIGKTHFGLGNFTEAADMFQLLIEKYPQFEKVQDARIQIAQAYYNQGRFDLAATKLQEFLNNYPKDPKAKDVLELLQMANYRGSKGQSDLAALTEKFPKSKLTADIYWQLGAEAYNEKAYKKALEFFRKLVGEFPEAQQVAKAYYYMAECYFSLEEYPNAVTAYKNYTLNFPSEPDRLQALFRLGVSHFQTKNYNEAVIAFNNALEADPKGAFARDCMMNIALSYKNMSQPNQAVSSYEKLLRSYPQDAQRDKILLQIGALLEENKSYEDALKRYQMVDEKSEDSFAAVLSEAKIYRLIKQPSKEIEAYERLRLKSPASNEVRLSGMVQLAELYQENGKIDEAIVVYEDIVKNSVNPDWRDAAKERAKALRSESK